MIPHSLPSSISDDNEKNTSFRVIKPTRLVECRMWGTMGMSDDEKNERVKPGDAYGPAINISFVGSYSSLFFRLDFCKI